MVRLQGALLSLAVVSNLVKATAVLERWALEPVVNLLSRLIMLPGARSAVQFVEAGGPSKALVAKMLDPTNRPGLIVDALILLSMLARISKDYYPHLLRADLFPPTLKLLRYRKRDRDR